MLYQNLESVARGKFKCPRMLSMENWSQLEMLEPLTEYIKNSFTHISL